MSNSPAIMHINVRCVQQIDFLLVLLSRNQVGKHDVKPVLDEHFVDIYAKLCFLALTQLSSQDHITKSY